MNSISIFNIHEPLTVSHRQYANNKCGRRRNESNFRNFSISTPISYWFIHDICLYFKSSIDWLIVFNNGNVPRHKILLLFTFQWVWMVWTRTQKLQQIIYEQNFAQRYHNFDWLFFSLYIHSYNNNHFVFRRRYRRHHDDCAMLFVIQIFAIFKRISGQQWAALCDDRTTVEDTSIWNWVNIIFLKCKDLHKNSSRGLWIVVFHSVFCSICIIFSILFQYPTRHSMKMKKTQNSKDIHLFTVSIVRLRREKKIHEDEEREE